MDNVDQLQRQYTEYLRSLYSEGILDVLQFNRLQQLQNENRPDLALEMASTFFQDTEESLNNMALALMPKEGAEFQKVIFCLYDYELKLATSSLGAMKVKNACITFQSFCEAQNRDECLRCLGQLAEECIVLNNKLQTLFKMGAKILVAGGTIPVV